MPWQNLELPNPNNYVQFADDNTDSEEYKLGTKFLSEVMPVIDYLLSVYVFIHPSIRSEYDTDFQWLVNEITKVLQAPKLSKLSVYLHDFHLPKLSSNDPENDLDFEKLRNLSRVIKRIPISELSQGTNAEVNLHINRLKELVNAKGDHLSQDIQKLFTEQSLEMLFVKNKNTFIYRDVRGAYSKELTLKTRSKSYKLLSKLSSRKSQSISLRAIARGFNDYHPSMNDRNISERLKKMVSRIKIQLRTSNDLPKRDDLIIKEAGKYRILCKIERQGNEPRMSR